MMEDFYTKDLTCELCGREFPSLLVRKSKQAVTKTDSDFCAYYEGEVPYFYHVFICPACGYAFLESFTKKPGNKMKEKLSPLPDFFSGKRDAPTAQLAYKRAIECAKMQREDDAVLASLHLQLGWICRLTGDEQKELAALREALGHYVAVYESSNLPDASKVMYLIGELNRRLGNLKEAVFWYSKVAGDEKCSAAMRRRARDAWQSLRN
jgi:uncharacterized protein